jgi:flagellin-like protein
MKGISPLIATILLIAFTVSIGGVLSLWLTSLTKTQIGTTESQASAVIKCSSADLKILSASSINNRVIVTHYGYGLKFYPLTIQFSDGTVNTTFAPANSITAGNTSTINVTFPAGANWVKITGSCEYGTANTTIDAACRSPEDCWTG